MPIPPWLQDHCNRLIRGELTNLNLNIRKLDNESMQALADALYQQNTLVVLNLTSSLSQSGAIAPLRDILAQSSLEILHLSYNRLTDVSAIGVALTTNVSLRELYLNYNIIDNCDALVSGLCRNKTLEILQLGSNEMGDQGCQAIAGALTAENNKHLRILGLSSNQITNAGARWIEKALTEFNNVTLEEVDLQKNSISEPLLASISLLCRANRSGRKVIHSADYTLAIWPHIFAKHQDDLTLLYFFVRSVPGACLATTTSSKKRGRGDAQDSRDGSFTAQANI